MAKERVSVAGLGEVGHPLFELLRESGKFEVYGFDVDEAKMREACMHGQDGLPGEVDVRHACIPCGGQNKFVDTVVSYMERVKPKLVIIHSTVPPGTTRKLFERCGCRVVHSPVRGVYESLEHMKWELRRWTEYVGGADVEAAETAREHLEKLGLKTKVLKGSLETELAKLFEPTYRACIIICFQEMHRISKYFGADFDGVADFLEDTHRVRFDRPVMFPDVIGGHCLIPNVEFLLKSHDSEFLRLILEFNERRREEVKDESIRSEVEKIRKTVGALEKAVHQRRIYD